MAYRDMNGRPVWHAIQGETIAAGATPYLAMFNLRQVVPTRRRA